MEHISQALQSSLQESQPENSEVIELTEDEAAKALAEAKEKKNAKIREVAELVGAQQPAVILVAQRRDRGDRCRGDIDCREGIVLLKRDIRRHAIGRDGDVFRLKVLRHRGIRSKNPHAGRPQRVDLAVECRE